MPELNPDPKLKAAAEEIKAVIRKHDIAGAVGLYSETHSEFVIEITPSWSAAYVEPMTSQLRVRAKRADFKTDTEHRRIVSLTIQLLSAICDSAAIWFSTCEALLGRISKNIDFDVTSTFIPQK